MNSSHELVRRLYACFNSRDVDSVLAMLTPDIAWANGMDGGHVEGYDGIRDYWRRQWSVVDPHVEPMRIEDFGADAVLVEVRQTIRDLDGRPVVASGLKDKTVGHVFRFRDGKICRFEIRETP
ncbi:nuclear transport factor 2 family protein [Aureimonas phyllosphaerae]|uniref:nuclear transport factor 2 family protein n=1 Tax=Aureimonas phyllosphaerae TaxID=1166078 RepID=UPI003A5C01B2